MTGCWARSLGFFALAVLVAGLCVPAAAGADYAVKKFIVNAGDGRNPFSENAYVLSDPATGDAVLIDPGAADPRIAAYVAQKKLVVRKILYTHAHDDHIGGGRHFADLYKAKIAGPRGDAGLFSPTENRPEEWLDGDSMAVFGSLSVRVISTPGHTPGCLSFSWPEKKALFVGDVIVTWPRVEAGWAGLTLDMKQNVQSVGKLSDFGNVDIVGCGHGEPIEQGGIEVLKKLREQKV